MANIVGLEQYSEGIGQMVIKIIITVLLLASPCFAGTQQIRNVIGMATAPVVGCDTLGATTLGEDYSSYVNGDSTNRKYTGGVYVGASSFSACKIAVRLQAVGDLYEVRHCLRFIGCNVK